MSSGISLPLKVGMVAASTAIVGLAGSLFIGIVQGPSSPPASYSRVSVCEAAKHVGEAVEVSGRPVFVFPASPIADETQGLEVFLRGEDCLVKGQASRIGAAFDWTFRPARRLSPQGEEAARSALFQGLRDGNFDSVTLKGTMRGDGFLDTYFVHVAGSEYSLLE